MSGVVLPSLVSRLGSSHSSSRCWAAQSRAGWTGAWDGAHAPEESLPILVSLPVDKEGLSVDKGKAGALDLATPVFFMLHEPCTTPLPYQPHSVIQGGKGNLQLQGPSCSQSPATPSQTPSVWRHEGSQLEQRGGLQYTQVLVNGRGCWLTLGEQSVVFHGVGQEGTTAVWSAHPSVGPTMPAVDGLRRDGL